MNLKEFQVKAFSKTFTVVAVDIDDVAKCYPSADIVQLQGTHFFIGDGTDAAQSLTKATPVASVFTGTYSSGPGAGTANSHTTIPTPADLAVTTPGTVAFSGPSGCIAYLWTVDDISFLYDQNITYKFEKAGTYIMKLKTASDGGQGDVQYMKITVT